MIKQEYISGDLKQKFFYTEDGRVEIETSQDVEPYLKAAHEARMDEDVHKRAKSEMWKYASIPAVVVVEMINKGINPYKQEDAHLVKREIDLNYSYLKTTNAKGW